MKALGKLSIAIFRVVDRDSCLDYELFDLEDMLQKTHPQAVLAYTNTFDHRQVVEMCARHGIHVMMEKPLAVSAEDAHAIADAAHLAVGIDREVRAKTLFATAKDDIDEALAQLRSLRADEGFREAYRLGERMLAVDKARSACPARMNLTRA